MKVIVLTPNYPRKDAPMHGIFIYQQIKALAELGVECHVLLTHNWFPPLFHQLHTYWRQGFNLKNKLAVSGEGIVVHHVPVFIKMPSRLFPENPYHREGCVIADYIVSRKDLMDADWLYANFLTDYGYIGTIVKQRTGIKLAAIARGDDVHAWPREKPSLVDNIQAVLQSADLLFAVSDRLGKDALSFLPNGVSRQVKTVYNGINTSNFARSFDKVAVRRFLNLPLEFRFLVIVAAPVVLKGWLELFDSLSALRDKIKNWKLLAVTPIYSEANALDLRHEANLRNIGDMIIWLNGVSPENMPKVYQASDLFVLPSYNEGLSNSVLEALACGLPVITTDVGGHSEIIENKKNGLLISPKNALELREALEMMMESDAAIALMAKQTSQVSEKIGSYKTNAMRLVSFLSNFNQSN